jgi:hypothetical protein
MRCRVANFDTGHGPEASRIPGRSASAPKRHAYAVPGSGYSSGKRPHEHRAREHSIDPHLLDRGAATIALAGEDGLPDLIAKCSLLEERFFDRMPIKPLAMDEHWHPMIRTLSNMLPFEETELNKDDMPERLHNASGGKAPTVMKLTEAAAKVAYYDDRSTVLRIEHYKTAFGYSPWSSEINPFTPTVVGSRLRPREAQTAAKSKRDSLRIANRPAPKGGLSPDLM